MADDKIKILPSGVIEVERLPPGDALPLAEVAAALIKEYGDGAAKVAYERARDYMSDSMTVNDLQWAEYWMSTSIAICRLLNAKPDKPSS